MSRPKSAGWLQKAYICCDNLHTWTAVTEMLAAPGSGSLLSGEHDLTRISDSGRILPSHKERFARASIVMSLHSGQRIAMVDLWRDFPITDASARGSAYAGGGG